jgi:HAD superfamily hydrolase (TIGR01509 family)
MSAVADDGNRLTSLLRVPPNQIVELLIRHQHHSQTQILFTMHFSGSCYRSQFQRCSRGVALPTVSPSLAGRLPRWSSSVAIGHDQSSNIAVHRLRASNTANPEFALLFDCDGVLVETEELHRLAYNASFQHFDIHVEGSLCEWPPEYYDILANTVGGGKPKMRWHFGQTSWPVVMNPELRDQYPDTLTDEACQDRLIDDLQDKKTEFYKKIVEEVAEAREGILELMDEAIADPKIAVGICSAATKAGFDKVVNSVVGRERLDCMDVLMAGDDVTKKKPDPLIYNLARERIDLPAEKCVVIEDSIVGLRAAMGAGMRCVITPCGSTMGQDFIGEGASFVCTPTVAASGVTLRKIFPAGAEKPSFDF